MPSQTVQPSGRISADEIWTLNAVETHLGLGAKAMRHARRNGLRVKYIGRRGYVIGADLIAYLRDHAKSEK